MATAITLQLALSFVLTSAPLARASPPAASTAMQKAKTLFDDAEFEEVIRLLQNAIVNGTIAEADQQQAHLWLATSYVALDNYRAARRAFRHVLGNQPDYRLPPHSAPRVIALLEDVRTDPPRIAVTDVALRRTGVGVSANVVVTVANAEDAVAVLHWRCDSAASFLTEPIRKTAPASIELSVPATCGKLEYYAELLSGQERFAHDGLAGSPRVAFLPSDAPAALARPFYKTWWFWTIVSAAAAGGATAAIVLTRPQDTTAVVEVRGLAR